MASRSSGVVHVQSGVRGSVLLLRDKRNPISVGPRHLLWSEWSHGTPGLRTQPSMDELAFIHFHELSRSQPAREALFSNRFKNTAALSCCCRLVRRDAGILQGLARSGLRARPICVSACCNAAKKGFLAGPPRCLHGCSFRFSVSTASPWNQIICSLVDS